MSKLIIAGSRSLNIDPFLITYVIQHLGFYTIEEIVSGGAKGVDTSAELYAKNHNLPFTLFSADWDTHGKKAGPLRNELMAEYADALLLIWDGVSKGSSNMKKNMLRLNKPVYEIIIKKPL